MNKLTLFASRFLGALMLAFLVCMPGAAAQDSTDFRSYNIYNWGIKDFHSDIDIHQDSSFTVTETIVADFTQASDRHGIYRYIPIHYKDRYQQNLNLRFKLISVKDENGNNLTTETSWDGDNINLKIGDADTYIDGKTITYVIKYKLDRGLNQFDDHDELYWNVTGNGWDNAIVHASATITLPKKTDQNKLKAICYTGLGYSTEQDCQAQVIDDHTYQFDTRHLLPNNAGLTVAAAFPKNLITYPGPLTYIYWFLTDNWGYFIPILVFAFLYWRWYQYGRDPKAIHPTIMPEYEAPNGLRPAEIGTLLDDSVDMPDITSTIIDLATRGWLKIIETEKSSLFGKTAHYELQKIENKQDILNNFEQTIYDEIFDGKEKVNLDDLKYTFYKVIPRIKDHIYDGLVQKKYYTQRPDKARDSYTSFGVVGIMILFFGISLLAFLNVSVFLGLLLSCILIIIFGRYMPRKTQLGVDTYIHILGLEEFIRTAEKDRLKFYEKENIFEKLLPYAIALGLAEKWAKACEGIMKESPDWYQSSNPNLLHNFNTYYFFSNLNNFNNTLSTNMNTMPRSSSSSGFSGFSSGGGFSGGGFGGGGGGSW